MTGSGKEGSLKMLHPEVVFGTLPYPGPRWPVRWIVGMLAVAILAILGLQIGPAAARECFWDGSSPFCAGHCPSGYDTVKTKACVTGHKVYCCERLGSTTSDGPGHPYVPATRPAATACPPGLVWRERFDGDTVCVLPGERDANRRKRGLTVGPASACPSGLVWRERFDGDTVCVTPLERDANRRRRGLPVN
jgi:hypothetical protein